MRAAFSIWDNRIAPVFDTSERIRIIDVTSGETVDWFQFDLPVDLPLLKILRLTELNVEVLVCGAISREMHRLVDSYGIQVISFVTGDIPEILEALITGKSDWSSFDMPGCAVPAHRRRLRCNSGKDEHLHGGFKKKHE